jgi:hypothetical protein
VKNPITATEYLNFQINVFSRDPTTGTASYLFYDEYKLFVDIVPVTLDADSNVAYAPSGSLEFETNSIY